ncbi:Qat anti-phage system TatD family nuclease QatD [Adhaeribacter soli]|uniref:TatD family deoxyribonuclease n=1 Tax=Adhaeribacter soli TaxID=2607655 RepID=A0A5N1J4V9_9BACT|nr:Qat anti-phage system TatD family nuclease QatD [Adhaeribacter soli]KAA9340119.1 TatD family deoxyribonuclease [Adhaeribacter soli]
MHLIDTHFHLDLYPKPEALVLEIEALKIYTIAVTNTPSVFDFTYQVTKNLKYVRAAIGLHPELALQRKSELPLFKEHLGKTRFVGEIGLDYGNLNDLEKRQQRNIFESILDSCATSKDKILTVHSRGTASDVISTIGNNFPGKIILHWFSGSIRELEQAVEFGFYFSINSAMASSVKGKRLILNIPSDKLLTETDGPFIEVERKPALPSDVVLTLEKLATMRDISIDSQRSIIFNNFKSLLE